LGLKGLAKQWRKESIEEMEHADKLVERIIFLDGFPNMQVLDPLHIGQNVKEVLDCDLVAEMSARALYQEAAGHCHSVKDYVSRDLFEKLMADEEHHISTSSKHSSIWLASLASSSTRSTTSARWASARKIEAPPSAIQIKILNGRGLFRPFCFWASTP